MRRPWWKRVSPIMVMLPLAAITAVLMWPAAADEPGVAQHLLGSDTGGAGGGEAAGLKLARFTICGDAARVDCVVDGDTFWYHGEKIRVADINTPEVSEPGCVAEARLAAAATGRLQALLNAGPFTLEPVDRERDQYGRLLRTVTRGGESLGLVLVREGLAEEWRGSRGNWC